MTIDVRFTSGARATVEAPSVMAVRRKLATGADVVQGKNLVHLAAAMTVDVSRQAGHPCVVVALDHATAVAAVARDHRLDDDTRRAIGKARASYHAHLRAAARTGVDVRGAMIPGVRFISRWPSTGTKVRTRKRDTFEYKLAR